MFEIIISLLEYLPTNIIIVFIFLYLSMPEIYRNLSVMLAIIDSVRMGLDSIDYFILNSIEQSLLI